MSDERETADDDFKDFIAKQGDHTATYHDLGVLVDVMYDITKAQRQRTDTLIRRIEELESARALDVEKIRRLEERPELKYSGAYREGERYSEGHLVTRSGGLWLSTRETSRTPGTENSGWRLVVKEGRA